MKSFAVRFIRIAAVCVVSIASLQSAVAQERVSKPGVYSGYSPAVYDEYEMTSMYVAVRDGTKLAMDVFRPKQGGKVVDRKFPVLWMHTPYNRRTYNNGLAAANYPGKALQLVKYGYVVAVVDFRGLFASFGVNGAYNRGEWLDAAYWDAYDITEYLAKQTWSTGKVGMWGCSATGGSQIQAATSMPPSLKAIFPMSCEFDIFPFLTQGGVTRDLNRTPPTPRGQLPARDRAAARVDADQDEALLNAAKEMHRNNNENPGIVPFRDSISQTLNERWAVKSSPTTFWQNILKSKIAVYSAANWDEGATKYGPFFTFNNLTNPRKLIVGPATHCDWTTVLKETNFDIVVEEHRFFDYWLKGIDNGVMKEAPVYYYTYNAAPGTEWRASKTWPLANEKRVKFFLGDKSLGKSKSKDGDASDSTAVDYGTTAENRAQKGLIYSTEPLTTDVQVTGHPVVDLWISSTANNGDFFATLEDVAPDGTVKSYNMDGRLRASHRALHKPPYNNLGLPWHRGNEADMQLLEPSKPAELVFDLLPISYVFKQGHRIRLVVTFAERGTPEVKPAPQITLYRNAKHASSITLPIIE